MKVGRVKGRVKLPQKYFKRTEVAGNVSEEEPEEDMVSTGLLTAQSGSGSESTNKVSSGRHHLPSGNDDQGGMPEKSTEEEVEGTEKE